MTAEPLIPSSAVPVAHGWTLDALESLAASVVAGHRHWWPAGDMADQHAAAWDGITEHLLTAEDAPSRRDLYSAGLRSLAAHVRRELAHAGHGAHAAGPNAGAKFSAYWHQAALPGLDEKVAERLALPQILAALPPAQRHALHALAASGDYQAAAVASGVSAGTFEQRVHRARARFRELWHEGESPSRQWRKDKRVYLRTPEAPRAA